jgi:hypothetical protein
VHLCATAGMLYQKCKYQLIKRQLLFHKSLVSTVATETNVFLVTDVYSAFVFCILYFVFCILYFVFCILYFVFCILFFVFCILYFVFCILYFSFCILYFAFSICSI